MPTTNLSNRLSSRLRKRRQAASGKKRHIFLRCELLEPREYAGSMLLSLPGVLATLPSARSSGAPTIENADAAALASGRARQSSALASPKSLGPLESDVRGALATFGERLSQLAQQKSVAAGWCYATQSDAYSAAGRGFSIGVQFDQHHTFDWDFLIEDDREGARLSRLRDIEPPQFAGSASAGAPSHGGGGGNGEPGGGGGGGSATNSTGASSVEGGGPAAALPAAAVPAAATSPSTTLAPPPAATSPTTSSTASGLAPSATPAGTSDSQAAGEAPTVTPAKSEAPVVTTATTIAPQSTLNLGFENGLQEWDLHEVGGSAPDEGTIGPGGMILREGNSFLVSASRTFAVPDGASVVRFTYSELSFDTSDHDSINDAFEAALLDDQGRTLVQPFAPARDAFINFTEEQPVAAAPGVIQVGGTVTVDISSLAPDTSATLVFRLVNNDQDENTTVHIETVDVFSGDAPPQVSAGLANDTAPAGPGTDAFRSDGLTNDATIAGTVSDDIGIRQLEAQVDVGTYEAILPLVTGGQFHFDSGTLSAGPHRVTIRATDLSGQVTQAFVDFRINQPPVARAGGNRTINEGDTVQFDGSQSSDLEAPLFAQSWVFDDSATADGSLASHSYAQDGVHTATFTVVDTAGSTTSDTARVTVNNLPPEILQLNDPSGAFGQPIDLLATFRDAGLLDTHTATIDWGDGGADQAAINEVSGAGTASGHHTYRAGGHYSGQIILRDGDGGVTSRDFTVNVMAAPTLRVEVSSLSANEGQAVDLSAQITTAASLSGAAATVYWGDGLQSTGTITPALGGGAVSARHTYADNGSYTLRVEVRDSQGNINSGSATATITNVAPSLTAGYRFDVAGSGSGQSLVNVISGRFTDPGFSRPEAHTAETFVTSIDWGDGTAEPVAAAVVQGTNGVLTTGTFSASHHYAAGGIFTATVTVTDDDGGRASQQFHYGTARIDVVPDINLKSNGEIPVKVFSDPGFDCHKLDPASLRFGPAGAQLSGKIDGNSPQEVMTHFLTQQSGIRPSDTVAFLAGKLQDGTPFVGMDTITIVGGGKAAVASTPPAPLSPTSHHPLDFSNDGQISPIDALLVINVINTRSAAAGEGQAASMPEISPEFCDANGDGVVSPVDALLVINYLNGYGAAQPESGEGESSSLLAQSSSDTTSLVSDRSTAGITDEPAGEATVTPQPIDFSVLSDVTASSEATYDRSSWNDGKQTLYADFRLQNKGGYLIDGPLLVGVTNLSDPTVRVREFDGLTPDGIPFFDISHLLGDGTLSPEETSGARTLAFYDPQAVQFTYELVVLGKLNQPPAISSEPRTEALVGHRYGYAIQASDPDNDVLRYSLAAQPAGMEIDQATGLITWTPTASDLGGQSVVVQIADGRGGSAEQSYVLTVADNVPNRPPVFTSSAVVDGNVNTLYQYQAEAVDADDDPFVFSLTTAPSGMTIDPATGAITWTPAANQLGENAVQIAISDGRGGAAQQSFTIVVQQEAGNHAPIIISEPVTTPAAGSAYQYQVRALDPDGDALSFALPTAPAGAAIDVQGLITFQAQVGQHPFVVRVGDGRGGFDTQSFTVTANGNHPPVITSTPVTEFTIPPGDGSPHSGDVQPTEINVRLADGQTQTVAVQLNLPAAGSLVPNADVFLLFDDTGSFANTAPAVISQFQTIIDQLQAALPNVHFGFGVGRFEDYANATASSFDRPFLLNQPIVTTDQTGFRDAITSALARQAFGNGGDDPEGLVEALFQTATGLGFDGNNDGDTSDSGPAGSTAAQLIENASGDVPAFTSIDDPVGFSFRMLDVANVPTLPLDTTITRTMNPGSLNDTFQFHGTAGERMFFDTLSLNIEQPVPDNFSSLTVTQPRWSVYDSQNRLVARSSMGQVDAINVTTLIDQEFTLPQDDTFVLFVENTDIESKVDYSFRLTTPETIAVPYTLGTSISATISEPRERDQYTFTLTAPTRLIFDEITGDNPAPPFTWKLEGPSGLFPDEVRRGVAPGRSFNSPVTHTLLTESTIQPLPAGDYRLTIGGVVDATGDYQFRLSDLAQATPISTDTEIDTTIDHRFETQQFRFDAQAGEHITYVDLTTGGLGGAVADLIDPFGRVVLHTTGFDATTLGVAGTYTVVLESVLAGPQSFIINNNPPPVPVPFAVGDVVTGAIDRAGDSDAYSFSLTSPIHAYFDDLGDQGQSLLVRLTDGQNNTYIANQMGEADGQRQNKPFLFLPAGDYRIDIRGNPKSLSQIDPYSFQIKDIASADVLTYGVPIDGNLSPSETNFFTLSGTQGDQVSFGLLSQQRETLRLLSPTGDILIATGPGGSTTSTLPLTGTYRVLVENFDPLPATYTLTADLLGNVPVNPPPNTPLTIGDAVSGDISAPGEVDRYTFTLDSARVLAFDALSGFDNGGGLGWSLTGPDGAEVPRATFSFSDDPFGQIPPFNLDAGSYVLRVTSAGTISYSFRLLDLAAATPIDVGATVTGEISPAAETDMFQFQVTSPGRFFFDNLSTFVGNPTVQLVIVNPQGFIVASTGFLGIDPILRFRGPLDVEAVLTSPGTYTLLLEGDLNSQSTANYQFTVTALPNAPPTNIDFGQLVDTAISQPGEQDVYTFTLPQNDAIYMDAMSVNGTIDDSLRYTLTGPLGTIVNAQPFNILETIVNGFGVVNPFPAAAGEYTLTVDALGDATPSYRFQVLNPAQAASIPLDTPISRTLDPGNSSQLFRIDIPQPGTYYFNSPSSSSPRLPGQNIWRLYDPFGNVVFNKKFQDSDAGRDGIIFGDAEANLPFAGPYTLLFEGDHSNQVPVPLEFSVRPTVTSTIPLTLSQTITGNMANAGDTERYTFSVAADSLVYFDSLTNDSQLFWSLEGPEGPVPLDSHSSQSSRTFDHSDGIDRGKTGFEFLRLPAGDYVLTVDGTGDRIGPYQFRLVDAASASTVTPGIAFSGELSPPSETDFYRFEATAGDQIKVHSQGPLSGSGAMYSVVDPYGQTMISPSTIGAIGDFLFLGEDYQFTVPRTGFYSLLVEGRVSDTNLVPYTFNVEPIARTTLSAPVSDSLTLDSLQSGQIEDLRSFRTLSFDGTAGQRLVFDGVQAGGSTVFRLIAPSGQQFFGLLNQPNDLRPIFSLGISFTVGTLPVANRGPFTLPETGTYQLIVDDTEDSLRLKAPDGNLGGAGFRPGALPIILAATDTGTAFQPDGIDPIVGEDGVSIPLAQFLSNSRPSTPQGRGATIQGTVSALNSLGALVIGMGTNANAASAPRETLEAISRLTGAVNASSSTFDNNTSDPIDPGDPFYYQIQAGSGSITAQGVTAAILQSLQHVSFDVDVVPSDPSVVIENLSGIRTGLGAGDAANFNIRFTGDSLPHSFDLLFVKAGTGVILGSIPVRINANPYAYDAEATDPDGDTVSFSLTGPPAGASIDPQTGVISFVPTGPGLFPFTVEANDGRGGASSQNFFVTVNDGQPNQLPSITSSAITTTLVNQPYAYTVAATDPDGDSLSFFLTKAPDGMTIDSANGEITWTPAAKQLGASDVTIRVLDSHGGAATQSFQVTVTTNSVEAPPRIISTSPTAAQVGRLLRYDVSAIDPNLDPLQFDLPVKSPGMVIDPQGGTFVWRPTLDQIGTHDVILRVRDGRGGVELQAFQITVTLANTAPVITSRPTSLATADVPFVYQVRAQDAENDVLNYSLRSAAAGMSIDPSTGLFTWTPTTQQIGPAVVTIVVTDPNGDETTQDVFITVDSTSANQQPVISSSPRLRTGLQTLYLYQVQAADSNGDSLSYSLATAPQGMAINAAGLVSWQPSPNQLGDNAVELTVSDSRGGVATQRFAIDVASQPVNSAPVITSTAPTAATIGRAFVYDVVAVDADSDPLIWSLDEAPIGVSIDPEFGRVRWTPAADQRGDQTIVLRVTDPLGGSATQTVFLHVRSTNVPPVFTTSPPTQAAANLPYRYAPRAFDRDGDIPTFRLTAAPLGMTIDGATGVIDWTPSADQLGTHDVALVVDDGQGGTTRQLFRILVTQTLNQPPVITSTPPTASSIDFTYQYDASATDPDGDALFFDVLNPPDGMFIDGATGLVTWVPQVGQQGQHTITVQVTDARGAVASQTFTIDIASNDNPAVLSSPPLSAAAAGQLYRFDIPASDPDGDPLTYRLDVGPTGMTVDSLGRILWQTTPADVGNHPVQVTIADNRGAEIELDYTITVAVDSQSPRVTLAASENPVNIGGQVTFLIRATDDIAVASLLLTVNGTPVGLDRNGRGAFLASQAGLFDAVATATDTSGNVSTSRLSLHVTDPSDVNAPTVEITSPEDDAVVTTFTDITGTVNDDNLVEYTLSVAGADEVFTEIGHGNTPVIDGLLGRFDPTLLENDSYILRLTATDAGGNVSTVDRTISTTGNLKPGDFRMSFVDLSIPLSGIPITVTRSYDSLTARDQGDLGFGWQLDIRDTRLQTSVPATGDEADGIFNPFRERTHVSLTLPDGSRQGFTFAPRSRFNLFGLNLFRPEFTPDTGVTSTLTVDQFDLFRSRDGAFFGFAVGGLPYNPADSAFGGHYTLTTRDGTAYEIDGITGNVRRVTDRNSNTLTYTDDGVFSSTGVHVSLGRDPQGRITSVTDPAGNSIRYAYDTQGDLASVSDRDGNVTRLIYSPSRPHFLQEIIDPLGRTGVRSDYDVDGRLIRITNGAGAAVDLAHSPAQSEESFVDALGNSTTYVYDARGNIVTVIDPLGEVTRNTYDADDNLLSTTDPLGNTSVFTYDDRRDLLSETDPLGDEARFTYNAFGHVATSTDPLGRTLTNAYDNAGNLTASTDAAGGQSSFDYDSAGNLTSWKDPTGAVVSLAYNAAGQMITYTDAEGVVSQVTRDSAGNILNDVHTLQTVDGPKTSNWSYSYDAEDRVGHIAGPEGGVIQVQVNADGQYQSVIDPLGNSSQFEYNDDGTLSDRVGPDGRNLHVDYDAAGRPTGVVLPDGQRIVQEFDALGRMTASTNPDGGVVRSVYDAAGRRTESIDPLGRVRRYTYDAAGRVIRDELPDGSATTYTYDAAGQTLSTTDAEGKTTRFEYDNLGQMTRTLFADGSITVAAYDADQRVLSRTMPDGGTWRYSYSPAGRLLSTTDPAGNTTTYGHDSQGSMDEMTDARGGTSTQVLDTLGRIVRQTLPEGQIQTASYDALGHLVEQTDFAGQTTRYEYDVSGRLTRRINPDGTTEIRSYDDNDALVNVTDFRGDTTLTRDANGRVVSFAGPSTVPVDYVFDVGGQVTSVNTDAGATRLAYSQSGNLAQLVDPAGGTTSYVQDELGRPVQTTLPNGFTIDRSYDDLGRTTRVTYSAPSGQALYDLVYTRDSAGRIIRQQESTGQVVTYQYDILGRLTEEQRVQPGRPPDTIVYGYDANGNLVQRTEGGITENLTYDRNDRLLSDGTFNYTWDANGNLISKSDGVTTETYAYDSQYRLIRMERTGPAPLTVSYEYDFDNLLAARTVNGVRTTFVWDRQSGPYPELLEQRDAQGALLVRYEHGNAALTEIHSASGQTSFAVTDQLGTVRALAAADGSVQETLSFDAFGRLRDGALHEDIGFTGDFTDSATGLVYMQNRWYAPNLARFISRDSVDGNPALTNSLNRYAYSLDNPVNLSDPTGRFTLGEISFAVSIAGVLGGLAFSHSPSAQRFVADRLFHFGPFSFTHFSAYVYPFLSGSFNLGTPAASASVTNGLEFLDFPALHVASLFYYFGGGVQFGGSAGASVSLNLAQGYVFETPTPNDYTGWFVTLALSFSAAGQTVGDILKSIQSAAPPAPALSVSLAVRPQLGTSAGFAAFFGPEPHKNSDGQTVYSSGFTPLSTSFSFGISTNPAALASASFNVSLTYYFKIWESEGDSPPSETPAEAL